MRTSFWNIKTPVLREHRGGAPSGFWGKVIDLTTNQYIPWLGFHSRHLTKDTVSSDSASHLCIGPSHTWFLLPHTCTVPHYGGGSVPKTLRCHNSGGVRFHSTFLKKKKSRRDMKGNRLKCERSEDWDARWSVKRLTEVQRLMEVQDASKWRHFRVCFVWLISMEQFKRLCKWHRTFFVHYH